MINFSKSPQKEILDTPRVLGNVEVLVRSIIVVNNQNCQAYVYMFFVFQSSPWSCRISIFNVLSFTFLITDIHIGLGELRTLSIEGAVTDRNDAVEDIENNTAVVMISKVNESILKILYRHENGEDRNTKNTQR